MMFAIIQQLGYFRLVGDHLALDVFAEGVDANEMIIHGACPSSMVIADGCRKETSSPSVVQRHDDFKAEASRAEAHWQESRQTLCQARTGSGRQGQASPLLLG
jgi:hypothetical protein